MMEEKFLLPAGIGFAALCVFGAVALVLRSRRTREQDKLTAKDREELAEERRKTWRRRLAITSLSVSFIIIFCIAGIAAWLSYGAQRAYAFDRNGRSWTSATGFALLLDAGALGLSLLRLFEALTARSSQLTRLYLVGFIAASATMNLLHTPHDPGQSPTLGGRLVAVIPPLVYAIFLESLLKKVEELVLGKYPKKKAKKDERGYSLLLWVPFIGYPRKMWKQWRRDLLATVQYVRAPGSRTPLPAPPVAVEARPGGQPAAASADFRPVPQEVPSPAPAPRAETAPREPQPAAVQQPPAAAPVAESSGAAGGPIGGPAPAPAPAPASSPAPAPLQVAPVQQQLSASGTMPKKDQLRDALVAQILAGDLRVLDANAQVANGAAYRANMRLGKAAGMGIDSDGKQEGLLKPGAVRTAVKQLLPELRRAAEEAERARREAAAEPAPQHQAAQEPAAGPAVSRERQESGGEPTIGHQRSADTDESTKETALA